MVDTQHQMKIIGKRVATRSTPREADILLNTVLGIRRGRGICPRGVYRFTTFKEANEWMFQQLVKSSLDPRR